MNTNFHALNDVQRSLLALFSRSMSETEQNDIKELLLSYYDNILQQELNEVIQEKGYSKQDFEKVLNNSQRTKI